MLDAGDGDIAPKRDFFGNPRLDIATVENRGCGKVRWTDIGAIERQQGGYYRNPEWAISTLQSYPNPANDRVTILFKVLTEGPADLSVVDLTGRLVLHRRFDYLTAGEYRVEWTEFRAYPSGIYLCRLRQASGSSSWKIALVK